MKWPYFLGLYLGLCCATGLAQKDDAAALLQAERLGAQCVGQLTDLQHAATPGMVAHKEKYRQALGRLENKFKAQGELGKVLALREDLERAEHSAAPLQAKAELPEARQVQQELLAAERAGQQAAAKKMIAAAENALAQLAVLHKKVDPKNYGRIKKQADLITRHAALTWVHAVAPALTLPRFADPPPDQPLTIQAGKGEKYTFYPPGKEPALRNGRPLLLEAAFTDLRGALFNYTLAVTEAEGLPRVSLAAKNSALPAGTKLVIEYFAKYPNPRGFRRESVELIALPAIPHGSGLAVDGHGMRNYASRLVGFKSYRPLYGVIVSLFDEHGKLFMQGCAPSALLQECRRELPEAQ